jgi:hypothetical protein
MGSTETRSVRAYALDHLKALLKVFQDKTCHSDLSTAQASNGSLVNSNEP